MEVSMRIPKHFFHVLMLLVISCSNNPNPSDVHSGKKAGRKGGGDDLRNTLRILCWTGYASRKYVDQFKKSLKRKYGIALRIKVVTLSDPKDFFDALRMREVDIISPAHNLPKSVKWNYIKNNLVLPVNLANVPNYKYLIPVLKRAEYITQKNRVYGVPIVYGPYGLAYNKAVFKSPPKSWNVFWNPKYKGRYAISSDYHEANIYITALALGFNKQEIFQFDTINTAAFKKKLNLLAGNAGVLWKGVDRPEDLKGLALATAWGFSFKELKRKYGENWEMAHPVEGTTGWVDNWMLSTSLKHRPGMKKIAEEWINFTLSPEIQIQYMRRLSQYPVNVMTRKYATYKEIKAYHLDDPDYFRKNLILWKTLSIRNRNAFKFLWSEAKR